MIHEEWLLFSLIRDVLLHLYLCCVQENSLEAALEMVSMVMDASIQVRDNPHRYKLLGDDS